MTLTRFLLQFVPCLMVLALTCPINAVFAEDGCFPLGGQRFLFLDQMLLARVHGAHLVVNPPGQARLVLIADKPWEVGGITGYGNVLWDPLANLYRMYYVPICWDVPPGFCLAMATSTDGIHWQKPDLGVVPWQGSTANNIVIWAQREGTVFVDPNASSERRFAFISSHPELKTRLFTSPDGVRFRLEDAPISPLHSDSQISSFWDQNVNKYFHYPRRIQDGLRAIGCVMTERVDQPWPAPESIPVVMSRDDRDPPEVDLYTSSAEKYPLAAQTYLAFPTPYYHYNCPAERAHLNEPTLAKGGKTNDGTTESQLATSRDGCHWTRYRAPYISLGDYDGCEIKIVHPYPGISMQNGKLVQYFAGYTFTHGDTQVRYGDGGRDLGGVFRVEQRIDGFVSLDFDYAGGEVVTEPFTFSGNRLILNVNTSAAGEGRVAIMNADGDEFDGFGLDDARYINGNYLDKIVHWKQGSDVGQLAGQPVRLRFVFRGTKLYSFRFDDRGDG